MAIKTVQNDMCGLVGTSCPKEKAMELHDTVQQLQSLGLKRCLLELEVMSLAHRQRFERWFQAEAAWVMVREIFIFAGKGSLAKISRFWEVPAQITG